MPIWLPDERASRPDDQLISWAAFEVDVPTLNGPTIHLAGYIEREGAGRVTSPLIGVDRATRTFTTRSYSTYRLVGAPGLSGDAEYVWKRWLRIWKVDVHRDVTDELLRVVDAGDRGAAQAQQGD